MKQRIKSVVLFAMLVMGGLVASTQAHCREYASVSEAIPQENQLTGTVKDSKGEPIIGATIQIRGTATGTATDIEGNFTLDAAPGTVLVVSFVGYKKQEITVGADRNIAVVLKEDVQNLGEVVVTAMGIRKTNRTVGYAMSTVKGEDIVSTNTVNPITALQGKVAGLDINIVGASGVQSSPGIVIRGAKSLSKSAQPIFVIDGIVMENNESNAQGTDWGSQLKNLNPDDYAEVTVLKGAAATALYGSRGANGAVVITSKTGKGTKGIGVELNYTYQWENIYANSIELQNVFGMGSPLNGREGNFGDDGNPTSVTSFNFGPRMEGQMIKMYYSDQPVAYTAHKDNWKALYQNGGYQNINAAVSGGSDRGNFRLSYSNTLNKGVLPGNQLKRNAISLRGNSKPNEVFSVDFGVSYTKTETRNGAAQGQYFDASNFGRTLSYVMPRNFDLEYYRNNYRNDDGSLKEYDKYFVNIRDNINRIDSRDDRRREESVLANLQLNMQFTSWLDASVKVNYNLYRIFNETKERGTGIGYAGGYYGIGGEDRGTYNGLAMLHGGTKLLDDRLSLDVRVMSEIYGNNRTQSWSKHTEGGLITPEIYSIANSVSKVFPSYEYTPANQRTVGLAGIVNLNWKEQVNLEITGRNDWMSTLMYPAIVPGKNNNTVFYPSVNLSWMFTDTFRDHIPEHILTFGKLRASLAYVGMGTSPYETTLGGYSYSSIYNPAGGSITIANVNNAGVLPNFDLKPEKQRTLEFGADLRFLDDRLGVDFAWYKQNTKNQILKLAGVPEAGFTQRSINAGDIQNTGIEIQLDATPVWTSDWRWDISMNFTRNRGKVKKLHRDVKEFEMMGNYQGVSVYAYEGGAFGVMTSTYARAKDPETGKYIVSAPYMYSGLMLFDYKTENDMGRYNENYKRTPLGNVQPDCLAGLSTTLTYKGWQMNVGLNARFGGVIYSSSYNLGMGNGSLKESLKGRMGDGYARTNYNGETVYDGFIPDAIFAPGETYNGHDLSGMTYQQAVDNQILQPVSSTANYANNYGWQTNVDQAVFDNTWIKLRELSLSYNFNRQWLQKIHLQGLQLTFAAHNIGYLYNGLKGKLNPESIQSNDPFQPVEYGGVPFSRSFSMGVKVKF